MRPEWIGPVLLIIAATASAVHAQSVSTAAYLGMNRTVFFPNVILGLVFDLR